MELSGKARLIVTAVTVLMFMFGLCSVAFASEPYGPTHRGDLNITLPGGGSSPSGGVAPGAKVTISGSGFAPNAKYDILWNGAVYIDPYTDANGFASYEVPIPDNATSGIHTISMQGPAAAGGTLVLSTNVTVEAGEGAGSGTSKAKEDAAFPFTGGGVLLFVLVAGVVLISVGLGMKLLKKTR